MFMNTILTFVNGIFALSAWAVWLTLMVMGDFDIAWVAFIIAMYASVFEHYLVKDWED